jgi:hypothetical protein
VADTQPVPAPRPGTGNLFRLVEEKLRQRTGHTIDQYLDEQRVQDVPYRLIAIQLGQLTGVDVTPEAVRRWYHAIEANPAAPATT